MLKRKTADSRGVAIGNCPIQKVACSPQSPRPFYNPQPSWYREITRWFKVRARQLGAKKEAKGLSDFPTATPLRQYRFVLLMIELPCPPSIRSVRNMSYLITQLPVYSVTLTAVSSVTKSAVSPTIANRCPVCGEYKPNRKA